MAALARCRHGYTREFAEKTVSPLEGFGSYGRNVRENGLPVGAWSQFDSDTQVTACFRCQL